VTKAEMPKLHEPSRIQWSTTTFLFLLVAKWMKANKQSLTRVTIICDWLHTTLFKA
jgi:hypothetical protein